MHNYCFKTRLTFIPLLTLLCLFFNTQVVESQSCNPPGNLEPSFYNPEKASFRWDYSSEAGSYVMRILVNGEPYATQELPGNATSCSVAFNPKLKHHDQVEAQLTKNCINGAQKTAGSNFIIITDIIVYLEGGVDEYGKPLGVEPVLVPYANLNPDGNVCGWCDVDFFRLESGFYSFYDISTSVSSSYPIELLRFRKPDICNCIDNAIKAGVIGKNGGHGENYKGEPFVCNMKLYVFQKEDCETGGGRSQIETAQTTEPLLSVVPNPANGSAEIRYHLQQETSTIVSLYDFTGKIIEAYMNDQPQAAGDHQLTIHVDNLTPGLYLCVLRTGTGLVQTEKVVVAH